MPEQALTSDIAYAKKVKLSSSSKKQVSNEDDVDVDILVLPYRQGKSSGFFSFLRSKNSVVPYRAPEDEETVMVFMMPHVSETENVPKINSTVDYREKLRKMVENFTTIQNFDRDVLGKCRSPDPQSVSRMEVMIPSFKYDSGQQCSAKDVLKKMGIKQALEFQKNNEFKNLVDAVNPTKIGDLVTSTKFETNRNGSKAEAYSEVQIVMAAGGGGVNSRPEYYPPKPKAFYVNRPFAFCIYDKKSKNVHIAGVILDPEEKKIK